MNGRNGIYLFCLVFRVGNRGTNFVVFLPPPRPLPRSILAAKRQLGSVAVRASMNAEQTMKPHGPNGKMTWKRHCLAWSSFSFEIQA